METLLPRPPTHYKSSCDKKQRITTITENLIGRCNNSTRGIHQCTLAALCICVCVCRSSSCLFEIYVFFKKMLFSCQQKTGIKTTTVRPTGQLKSTVKAPPVCECLSVFGFFCSLLSPLHLLDIILIQQRPCPTQSI